MSSILSTYLDYLPLLTKHRENRASNEMPTISKRESSRGSPGESPLQSREVVNRTIFQNAPMCHIVRSYSGYGSEPESSSARCQVAA